MVDNSNIAAAIERGISGQSSLIISLSLAVMAGLYAVTLQTRFHNASNPAQQITLSAWWAFWLAELACGLSILLGYMLSGTLIQMAPALHSHTFDASKKFSDHVDKDVPIDLLGSLSMWQASVFVFAVFFSSVFLIMNRK